MKKIFAVLIVLVFIFCFTSCGDSPEQYGKIDEYEYIAVWTDPETGVQYIIYRDHNSRGGITPRYNADGTLCVVEIEE